MVDYAMGSALWAQRNEGEAIATLSISVNYLQSATEGDIVCHAHVDRRNRTRGDAARDRAGGRRPAAAHRDRQLLDLPAQALGPW